jgi:hypothetical protein
MYKLLCRIFMILLLSCCLLVLSVSGAQEDSAESVYQQLLQKLESLTPGNTIEVRMGTEKEEYNVKEPFEARFQTNKDCYIVLMDIAAPEEGTDGTITYGGITFLIPSSYSPDNKVEGRRVYSTLHDFKLGLTVAPPYGYETLNLFCSTEKLDLFDADFEKEPVYTIKPDDEEKIRKLLDRLDRLNAYEWSGNSVSFLITGDQAVKGVRSAIPRKFGALPPIGSTGTTGIKWFPPIGSTGTTGKTDTANTP